MRLLVIPALLCAALALTALSGAALNAHAAPDFAGGGPWFNTGGKALTLAALRGKVLAVEMWTGGCINCINTLPYVKQWDARYRAKGLVVVGVHSPEFQHEHSQQYVQAAIAREGIKYPVVMDNNFRIWDAYHNAYWPTLYLVDKRGVIRYSHIGEGEYDTTERTIAQLLAEPNP
jgi:thiol-disulfide isomerase/thioredoxin